MARRQAVATSLYVGGVSLYWCEGGLSSGIQCGILNDEARKKTILLDRTFRKYCSHVWTVNVGMLCVALLNISRQDFQKLFFNFFSWIAESSGLSDLLNFALMSLLTNLISDKSSLFSFNRFKTNFNALCEKFLYFSWNSSVFSGSMVPYVFEK